MNQIQNPYIRDILRRVEAEAMNLIAKHEEKVMYPEQVELMRFPVGTEQPTHFDTYSDLNNPEPNAPPVVPSTEWAAIVYINKTYTGGNLWFPKQEGIPDGYTYEPVAREMVVFQGMKFEHGVSKVYKDDRYTIPMWFTTNPKDLRPDLPFDPYGNRNPELMNTFK